MIATCGSAYGGSTTAPHQDTAATTSSRGISHERARQVAHHINLRQSDFPHYKAHPTKSSANATAAETQYDRCAGLRPMTVFEDVEGRTYENHELKFNSGVEFVTSRHVALRDIRRRDDAHGRHCYKRAIKGLYQREGASQVRVKVKKFDEPLGGADALGAVKIVVHLRYQGLKLSSYVLDITFSRANVEVELVVSDPFTIAKANATDALATLENRASRYVPPSGFKLK